MFSVEQADSLVYRQLESTWAPRRQVVSLRYAERMQNPSSGHICSPIKRAVALPEQQDNRRKLAQSLFS